MDLRAQPLHGPPPDERLLRSGRGDVRQRMHGVVRPGPQLEARLSRQRRSRTLHGGEAVAAGSGPEEGDVDLLRPRQQGRGRDRENAGERHATAPAHPCEQHRDREHRRGHAAAAAPSTGKTRLCDREPARRGVAHVLFGVRRGGEELVIPHRQIRGRQQGPEAGRRELGYVALAVDGDLYQRSRRGASGDHRPSLVEHGAVRGRFDGRRRRHRVGHREVDLLCRQRDVARRVGRLCRHVVVAERQGGRGRAAEGSGGGRVRRAQLVAARHIRHRHRGAGFCSAAEHGLALAGGRSGLIEDRRSRRGRVDHERASGARSGGMALGVGDARLQQVWAVGESRGPAAPGSRRVGAGVTDRRLAEVHRDERSRLGMAGEERRGIAGRRRRSVEHRRLQRAHAEGHRRGGTAAVSHLGHLGRGQQIVAVGDGGRRCAAPGSRSVHGPRAKQPRIAVDD